MKAPDMDFIHPEDLSNISYWSRKWGVSTRQLNDAIIDTGSLSTNRIRNYLKKDIWYSSPAALWKLLRTKLRTAY